MTDPKSSGSAAAETADPTSRQSSVAELRKHIHRIEEGYEFFLAYAAQGYSGEARSKHGGQLRSLLEGTISATRALEPLMDRVQETHSEEEDALGAFRSVVTEDARKALAALRLVHAQEAISSQMVDNLNASIHLRALLTDLFLLDEVLSGSS